MERWQNGNAPVLKTGARKGLQVRVLSSPLIFFNMENTDKQSVLISRPPIIVVLGHVDHGKTSLLDYIKKTKIASQESGGITQHIGAYEIEVNKHKITFIDTPGHEAFSKIRSRGAKIADIAILVIAAEEGVKPQTKESLKIIQEENIPFIIAFTKIDKSDINIEKVKNELSEVGVLLEGRGGDISCVGVSSKSGEGIDELLELIILLAEMQELKADPKKPASGVVIESHLDRFRGNTATLIITDGTLYLRDEIVAGNIKGKVKILEDFQGKPINEATFSMPVQVVGFEDLAPIGEKFTTGKAGAQISAPEETFNLEIKEIGNKDSEVNIPLVIKCDTISSGEALEQVIKHIAQEKNWLFSLFKNEVGDIAESDLKIIPVKDALIIGFGVKKKPEINNFLLTQDNFHLIESDIIYEIQDKIEQIVEDKFIEKPTEEILGKLEVLAVFNPVKGNQLIGGRVTEGKIQNKNNFYLYQDEQKIGQGKILNLERNRVEANEVKAGEECGLLVSLSKEIKKGNELVFFRKI